MNQDIFIKADDEAGITAIVPVAAKPIEISPALKIQIDRGWAALLAYRDITVNDTLLRVLLTTPQSIQVATDITYQSVVGARYCSAVADTPYQALSAMAIVVTSDNQLVLLVRDSGDWPRSYECVGGFVRARYTYPTVEAFIADRVARELGVVSRVPVKTLGSYQFTSIAEHMLIYRYEIAKTALAVQQTFPHALTFAPSDIDQVLDGTATLPVPIHHPTAQVLRALGAHQLL